MKLPFQIHVILAAYSAYEQPAFVAGGAVRDTIFNKPIKDYDIFIQSNDGRDYNELRILADRLNMTFNWLGDPQYNALGFDVYRLKSDNLTIECIVGSGTIEDTLERFQCNASKVYYDHKRNTYVKHADFVEFERTKKLVFSKDSAYSDRIKEKYPECVKP